MHTKETSPPTSMQMLGSLYPAMITMHEPARSSRIERWRSQPCRAGFLFINIKPHFQQTLCLHLLEVAATAHQSSTAQWTKSPTMLPRVTRAVKISIELSILTGQVRTLPVRTTTHYKKVGYSITMKTESRTRKLFTLMMDQQSKLAYSPSKAPNILDPAADWRSAVGTTSNSLFR